MQFTNIKSLSRGSGKIRLVLGLVLVLFGASGIDAAQDSQLWMPMLVAILGLSCMGWSIKSINRGQ